VQRNEQLERIALLLRARAEDTGDDLLRLGAARRSVAAAHFAGRDGRPDRLLGCQFVASTPGWRSSALSSHRSEL
jgi:hypothetical protein